jgi:hypothetical protein
MDILWCALLGVLFLLTIGLVLGCRHLSGAGKP